MEELSPVGMGVAAVTWLAVKVLGPPADALGEALSRYVGFRADNVFKVLENAHGKLGERTNEPGGVHPRVAIEIFEDGGYSDDDMMIEYLGGVLASSRSGMDRDDRAAKWAREVTAMSVYEIRAHYLVYAGIADAVIAAGRRHEFGTIMNKNTDNFFFVYDDFIAGMDFVGAEDEPAMRVILVAEALRELCKLGLISDDYYIRHGSASNGFCAPGRLGAEVIRIAPTASGVAMFLYAHGVGGKALTPYANPTAPLPHFVEPVPMARYVNDFPVPGYTEPIAD